MSSRATPLPATTAMAAPAAKPAAPASARAVNSVTPTPFAAAAPASCRARATLATAAMALFVQGFAATASSRPAKGVTTRIPRRAMAARRHVRSKLAGIAQEPLAHARPFAAMAYSSAVKPATTATRPRGTAAATARSTRTTPAPRPAQVSVNSSSKPVRPSMASRSLARPLSPTPRTPSATISWPAASISPMVSTADPCGR